MTEPANLPDDMREWIEASSGGTVLSANRQAGGGRKQAWFVDVERDGERVELFLRWDQGDPVAAGDPWTVRREAEVYRALRDTAVPVARFVAMHPTRQAMLATRVHGRNWFSHIKDAAEQEAVARDFIRQLAALHALDVRAMGLPGVDPEGSVADYVHQQLDELDAIVAFRSAPVDPVLRIALDHLRANVPAVDGPAVLVQGDTGPGNFMYADGRVTAVVDWELAHPGDPMDDIAWVSLRAVQEPFTDLRRRFAEYSALTGTPIDGDRVRYYRVLGEAKILVMNHGVSLAGNADTPEGGGDVGAKLVFGQLHRRLCAEALAEVLAVDLPPVDVPPVGAPTADVVLFDEVLGQLRRVVVPRITDSFASQRAKGVARILKFLAARAERGAVFDRLQCEDAGELLGARFDTVRAARTALSEALAAGRLDPRVALPVLYRGVQLDNELLRDASGALADRHYESPV